MLVLAVDMEEAFVSLGKVGTSHVFAQTSLVDFQHKIRKTFDCPFRSDRITALCIEFCAPTYGFDDGLTQRRACHSFRVYRRDHSQGEGLVFFALGKELIHGLILEKRYLMLVAQDPHIDKEIVSTDVISRSLKVLRIQPELKFVEERYFHIREFELAFCCFFERSVERGAEVVRVEAEEFLVQSVWLLLFSDDEVYGAMEMFATPRISIDIISRPGATYGEAFLLDVETAPVDGAAALG
jgi:hypothetical protein